MINSKHVIKFIKVVETKEYICIVSEYCGEGTLLDYLKKNKITENEAISYFI